jgi:eukaryotic-like serine/threonine-protein kinase
MANGDENERATLAETGFGRPSGAMPVVHAPGTKIGRYVVAQPLGAGGMGVVYVAHDPELDRDVAIKLLHTAEPKGAKSIGRTRLLREAQAMAKLEHPNVVTIYDVGEHLGAVYIAMERVEGCTLQAWLAQRSRGWSEVLEVCVAAGRGLAAAHAKDLVHRDFKPENVMVADDGRVLVMDFGLARGKNERATDPEEYRAGRSASESLLSSPLTQTGSVLGTPAYMAPEQHLAIRVDARSDQFSFCVTLYEGLFGQRPFEGETLGGLAVNVTEGRVRPVPRSAKVPQWVVRTCMRGLAAAPEDRFESMDALLDALVRGRKAASRRRIVVALGAVAVLGAGGWSTQHLLARSRLAACERIGDGIEDVYADLVRDRIRRAFSATGRAGADTTAEKVITRLDAWTDAWRSTRVETCTARDVLGTLDPGLAMRADACLQERRIRLETLVAELAEADEGIVYEAVSAAASLPMPTSCGELGALAVWPAFAPELEDEVMAVVRTLGVANAQMHAGRYASAMEAAERAHDLARAGHLTLLRVEAAMLIGSLHSRMGDYEQAETVLAQTYVDARIHGAENVAADAAINLVHVVGAKREHHAEALVWARVAEAAIVPLEPEPGARTGRWLAHLAGVRHSMGDYEDALALLERSLELRKSAQGDDHPDIATALGSLAMTHRALGDYSTAKSLYERAVAMREQTLGAEHPDVAGAVSSLALLHITTGDYAEAIVLLEHSRTILERTLGAEHPDVASVLHKLAVAHRSTGDLDAAMPLYERSLSITRTALGPDHSDVARALNNIATIHHMRGESEEEKVALLEALSIWERTLGPEHPEIAGVLGNLAKLHESEGDYAEARVLFERALAIRQAALGPDHPRLAYLLVGLANVALEGDRPVDALAHARRAVTLREGGRASPAELAEARFVLAQALWAATPHDGGDRATARELAERAARQFRTGEGTQAAAELVEGWLAEHP